jgi:hypothetical protein
MRAHKQKTENSDTRLGEAWIPFVKKGRQSAFGKRFEKCTPLFYLLTSTFTLFFLGGGQTEDLTCMVRQRKLIVLLIDGGGHRSYKHRCMSRTDTVPATLYDPSDPIDLKTLSQFHLVNMPDCLKELQH